jgi:hypothetical protein
MRTPAVTAAGAAAGAPTASTRPLRPRSILRCLAAAGLLLRDGPTSVCGRVPDARLCAPASARCRVDQRERGRALCPGAAQRADGRDCDRGAQRQPHTGRGARGRGRASSRRPREQRAARGAVEYGQDVCANAGAGSGGAAREQHPAAVCGHSGAARETRGTRGRARATGAASGVATQRRGAGREASADCSTGDDSQRARGQGGRGGQAEAAAVVL